MPDASSPHEHPLVEGTPSKVPATIDSPLGQDLDPVIPDFEGEPSPSPSDAPSADPATTTPEVGKVPSEAAPEPSVPAPDPAALADLKTQVTQLQSQLAQSQDAQKALELIESDPEASQWLRDHFQMADPSATPATHDPAQTPAAPEVAALRQELEQTKGEFQKVVAAMMVKDFASKTPDFETFRAPMKALIDKYPQLSLEDAYSLAKAQGNPQTPQTELQPTEARAGTPSPSSEDETAEVLKRIDQAKDLSSGIALAFREAQRRASSS